MSSFIDTDTTMKALQFTLDGLSKRAQIVSNNVANADTPNYKASIVTFEDSLRQALAGKSDNPVPLVLTDGAHIDPDQLGNSAKITETELLNLVNKNDNNNVDIDREMTTLAEANILYDAMVQLSTSKLAELKSSIADVRP